MGEFVMHQYLRGVGFLRGRHKNIQNQCCDYYQFPFHDFDRLDPSITYPATR